MENDGDLDVWMAANKLYYAENEGSTFKPIWELTGSSNPVEAVFADLDGDETQDLIAQQGDILYWRSNQLCQMPQDPSSIVTNGIYFYTLNIEGQKRNGSFSLRNFNLLVQGLELGSQF